MARWKGTTTQRGLGAAHVKDKNRLLALHRDGDPCWRCGQPMFKSQGLERDHVVDRSLGGIDGPAVLAHAHCNRSAGAKLGNQQRPFKLAALTAAGQHTICKGCGRQYTRPARGCEICGAHYHPTYQHQRTCGRLCGSELQRRNRLASGWAPKLKAAAGPRAVKPRTAKRAPPSSKPRDPLWWTDVRPHRLRAW